MLDSDSDQSPKVCVRASAPIADACSASRRGVATSQQNPEDDSIRSSTQDPHGGEEYSLMSSRGIQGSRAFQFIDEREIRQPENAEIRRAIRAHARRDVTLRRQRENEAYSSRFARNRRLLKKDAVFSTPDQSPSPSARALVSTGSDNDSNSPSIREPVRPVTRNTRATRSIPIHVFPVASSQSNTTDSTSASQQGRRLHQIMRQSIPMQSTYTPNVSVSKSCNAF